jgi:hypothetical protein
MDIITLNGVCVNGSSCIYGVFDGQEFVCASRRELVVENIFSTFALLINKLSTAQLIKNKVCCPADIRLSQRLGKKQRPRLVSGK